MNLNEGLNWKKIGSVTGTNKLKLPNEWKELYLEVDESTTYGVSGSALVLHYRSVGIHCGVNSQGAIASTHVVMSETNKELNMLRAYQGSGSLDLSKITLTAYYR